MFTFIGIFADKVLGFKNHSFEFMILGNDNHFRRCIFYLGITYIVEQVSSSQIFLNGWELYKVGDSRRDAGFGLFIPEYWTLLLGGCLFVYLGTSQTTVGVMLAYQL
jgi:POT family proton-dependent oligopeptide transporter